MGEKLDIEELEGLLKIDRADLDSEVERQPTLYYKVAAEAARLRSEVDAAKDRLDRTSAELDLLIRENALRDDEKITEGGVRSRVTTDKAYQAAITAFSKVKQQLDQTGALQEAFRQRSYMLRDLVELYISGYFTDAVIKGHANRARDNHALKNQEKMSERRRERLK